MIRQPELIHEPTPVVREPLSAVRQRFERTREEMLLTLREELEKLISSRCCWTGVGELYDAIDEVEAAVAKRTFKWVAWRLRSYVREMGDGLPLIHAVGIRRGADAIDAHASAWRVLIRAEADAYDHAMREAGRRRSLADAAILTTAVAMAVLLMSTCSTVVKVPPAGPTQTPNAITR